VTPLVSEELMHVCRAAGRARSARGFGRTTIARIASEAFILPRGQHTLRQFIEAAFAASRRPLHVAFELDSRHTLKLAVEASIGSSLLTWSVVHRDVVEGRLSARRIADLRSRRTVALCCSQLFPETPAAGAVCGLLPGVVADLVRRCEWHGGELVRA
jgi:LysR family nitrogen assimilation transcriptional regulator